MRFVILAICTVVLFNFVNPASADSVRYRYLVGPDGPMMVTIDDVDAPLTVHDIQLFASDVVSCDKLRFKAGIPRVVYNKSALMQKECMDARQSNPSRSDTLIKWQESSTAAAEICKSYAYSLVPVSGRTSYNAFVRDDVFIDCFAVELQ